MEGKDGKNGRKRRKAKVNRVGKKVEEKESYLHLFSLHS